MATASKKKPTAKRTTKAAPKAAYKPAKKFTKAAQANHPSLSQQSAKLYQMPFQQADMGEATKQAAENMMRMSSDAMQQWWSATQNAASNPQEAFQQAQAKAGDVFSRAIPSLNGAASSFNAGQAQEKFTSFARESAEHLNKSASGFQRTAQEGAELSRENLEALVEVSNIAVTISKEIGAEIITYANKSFAQNVELGKQVLTCRTLNDMFDLSSRFMKTNLDMFFSESVKLSEMLFQCATDVSEPLNERVTESTERLSKALAS